MSSLTPLLPATGLIQMSQPSSLSLVFYLSFIYNLLYHTILLFMSSDPRSLPTPRVKVTYQSFPKKVVSDFAPPSLKSCPDSFRGHSFLLVRGPLVRTTPTLSGHPHYWVSQSRVTTPKDLLLQQLVGVRIPMVLSFVSPISLFDLL